ncbi:putative DNA binding protein [Pseudomonas phage vB_PsyM_KIL3b]|uniref:DNA binding protein n=6 Tax=Flaumdravirus TaxID=2560133 RepID=A0A142IEU8_9CAUD|nr:HNH endonuclease [Pseudomonas phage vB_PsyM_KIL1]YP_009616706.1 HNH endonuclease [Pseudomonas phage vB_PsyM_KIL4]AMR57430.1 putative DNA binding protein [Pseudomonas phage vB_PsyM_KIL2]AMR57590.1 putative DNA binding protein [Pseudomonas phage vB_PsyM_KIL3]AMR57920.1 hypothetical protein vB_PsyM_KIL5_0020 [Pseudomonas phage vB_PsyM_KIL5]AMR58088.1 putative DNA binding protein [Pseudomonas phage vB_PsyM_KIL3b]AMR57270.1 putative DNA binding protein [Pseudomonas phage vB_PsyM_KIL1]
MIRQNSRKLIYGVGINDADYITQPKNRDDRCPIFDRWHSMLRRCYSVSSLKANPTYEMVVVCQDWLVFSNFKKWMEPQEWSGLVLDKDILGDGNIYSQKTCRFVPSDVNSFFSENVHLPIPGTRLKFEDGREKPYIAQAMVYGKKKYLGVFTDRLKAHKAWQSAKISEVERIIFEYPSLDKDVVKVLANCHLKISKELSEGSITRSLK